MFALNAERSWFSLLAESRLDFAAQIAGRPGGMHIPTRSSEKQYILLPALIVARPSLLMEIAIENTAVMTVILALVLREAHRHDYRAT